MWLNAVDPLPLPGYPLHNNSIPIPEVVSDENILMLDIHEDTEDSSWCTQRTVESGEQEYAIRKMISPNNARSSEAASEEAKARIISRNVAFASELSKHEVVAQRLSTPNKFATELHAIRSSTKDEDDARDVFECERENTVSRSLIANKCANRATTGGTQFAKNPIQIAGRRIQIRDDTGAAAVASGVEWRQQ